MFSKEALEDIRHHLLQTGQTIAVAESVSAGFLQASFSTVPDAAKFFQGGITAYNLGQKYRHLHVNPIHAQGCNCVSKQVAATMAVEVCRLFGSHWGVAITGYATKVPEGDNELYAFYAFAHEGKLLREELLRTLNTEQGEETQLYYVNAVLNALQKQLKATAAKQTTAAQQ